MVAICLTTVGACFKWVVPCVPVGTVGGVCERERAASRTGNRLDNRGCPATLNEHMPKMHSLYP
eukprot:365734-Chlamydomonas_euryale.AAC.17